MKKMMLFGICCSILIRNANAGESWTNYTNRNKNIVAVIADEKNIWSSYGYSGIGVTQWTIANGAYETITMEDGLSTNEISAMEMDRYGNLWFGGNGAVSKFDGKKWSTFDKTNGMIGGIINSIYADYLGEVWFAGAVLVRYTGSYWLRYTMTDGLDPHQVFGISNRVGNIIWANTGTEPPWLNRFDGNTWTKYNAHVLFPPLNAPPPYAGQLSSLYQDSHGKLWIATSAGVFVYDGENYIQYTEDDGLIDNNVLSMAVDEHENFWFGTKVGVSVFNGSEWISYTSNDGLPDSYVRDIYIDASGYKWFATGDGLCRFNGTDWTIYRTDDWLPYNEVRAVLPESNGSAWIVFSGERGICYYDGSTVHAHTSANGLARAAVQSIIRDHEDNIWACYGEAEGGVSKFDGNSWINYSYTDGLAGSKVYSTAVDMNGVLWFATNFGVSSFDGNEWKTYRESNGLANNDVRVVGCDNLGNKWFATSARRISRFDGQSWTTFTVANGVINNLITCMKAGTDGSIWFGAVGGACKYDGDTWTRYTEMNGVLGVNNIVDAIEIDDDGNVWFAARSGVYKFNGESWQQYGDDSRLMNVYASHVVKDSHGNLWFSGNKGISILNSGDPTSIGEKRSIPSEFMLSQNYPNPFNPVTRIHYRLARSCKATIRVYNILGREVKTLAAAYLAEGSHEAVWDGTNNNGTPVSSGIYIYRLTTSAGFSDSKKMLLLR